MFTITDITHAFHRSAAPTPVDLAATHGNVLDHIDTVLAHPRSLARDLPTWRPPTIALPAFGDSPALNASISRMRVGLGTQQFLHDNGEPRTASYHVTIRFTDPTGRKVNRADSDRWIQALLLDERDYDVHELLEESAPTYCWVTSSRFIPLRSPALLFGGQYAA